MNASLKDLFKKQLQPFLIRQIQVTADCLQTGCAFISTQITVLGDVGNVIPAPLIGLKLFLPKEAFFF